MILDATTLGEFQACKRRFVLSEEWKPLRWRAKVLFDGILRRAIKQLGDGAKAADIASAAKEAFMNVAADPGLDIETGNTYTISKDYCAMLETIIRYLSRTELMKLHEYRVVQLDKDTSWRVLANSDDSGLLHRWITVDSWSNNDIARELHSWWVMGDIAVAETPMVLHVVEIGQMRQGRRYSPWTRAYRHPIMTALHGLRFKKATGKAFEGWDQCFLADMPNQNPEAWVDAMVKDHVAQSAVHTLAVEAPSAEICQAIREEICQESASISYLGPAQYYNLPMHRNACDTFIPCPFQHICYSSEIVNPSNLGLYQKRVPIKEK